MDTDARIFYGAGGFSLVLLDSLLGEEVFCYGAMTSGRLGQEGGVRSEEASACAWAKSVADSRAISAPSLQSSEEWAAAALLQRETAR